MPAYQDFVISIHGEQGRYTVECRGPGEISVSPLLLAFRRTPELDAELEHIQQGYAPSRQRMQEIGSLLYEMLFPARIAAAFQRAHQNLPPETFLRLKLTIHPPELAVLPWELAYDPNSQRFLAALLTHPVARFIESDRPVASLLAPDPLRILYVQSQPSDLPELDLQASQQALQETVGGRAEIHVLPNTSLADLREALRQPFHILHYDGHAYFDQEQGSGALCLQAADGRTELITGDVLATYLAGSSVRLVVLAACQSGMDSQSQRFAGIAQQLMIASDLPAVVAMQYSIQDRAAIAFNRGLYGALADGYPVDAAVTDGRKAILEVSGSDPAAAPDWATPVLYLRATDGRLFALAQGVTVDQSISTPGEPPYMGLRYFDVGDASIFFGRETLVAQLVGRLREQRFLAVVGASGSGKSSVVRAGMVPALLSSEPLTDGTLPPEGSQRWQVHIVTPTAHPLETLALSLTRGSESVTAAKTLREDLRRDPESLHLYARRLLPDDSHARLLIVVDQFEEFFTACKDPGERQAFVDNLLTAVSDENAGPTVVLITLRADFYHHCSQYDNLRQALEQHQAYIGAMNADELSQAIENPAARDGWEIEPGLVDLMLRDVGDEPGALPLLSHALLETWKRRRGRTLTLAGYHEAGGVHGAIACTAETVYQRLDEVQQAIARDIFLRLTELGEGTQDTRRRADLSELIPDPSRQADVEAVLKTLADARLVTTEQETAEVAHEALIREWPALQTWLEENRYGLRIHRHLTEAAREWNRLGRDEGELYRGARLTQVMEWTEIHHPTLNPLEHAYLDASIEFAERQEAERATALRRELEQARKVAAAQRQRTILLTVGLVVAAILILISLTLYQQSQSSLAQAKEQNRIAQAGQLAAVSQSYLDTDLDLALLLSSEAVRKDNNFTTRDSLLSSLQQNPNLLCYLHGHSGSVNSVTFSPDGKMLASGGGDGTIRLWDVHTWQQIGKPLTGHSSYVFSVAFSPDGKMLASGSEDGTIRLWDAHTGQQIGKPLTGDNGEVYSIAFSPDGEMLVSGGEDGTIRLWNPHTGQQLGNPLTGHSSGVVSVAFSPDGETLASGSWDGTIRLWNPHTGQQLSEHLTGDNGEVYSIAFSPDGETLVSGSWNGTIRLWDALTGQPLGEPLTGHSGPVNSVIFSRDGEMLASGGRDGTIHLWDAHIWQQIGEPLTDGSGSVYSVDFSPDGKMLASGGGDGTIRLWDAHTGQQLGEPLAGHINNVFSFDFSPDGKMLASGGGDGTIRLWSVQTGQQLGKPIIGHSGFVLSVTFSPNGEMLASGGGDGTIRLWDVHTAQPLGEPLTGHSGPVNSVAFSPDGKLLASGSYDGTIRLWDAHTGQQLGEHLASHSSSVLSVAFSPNGEMLASGGDDGTIHLWDPYTGQQLKEPLTSHYSSTSNLAFSPDGEILAIGGYDGTIYLWDPHTGQQLGEPLTSHGGHVNSVAFSPDGEMLASGSFDGNIYLWNPHTGRQLGEPLTSHNGWIESVTFSPDGEILASAGENGNIYLWNPHTGQQRGEPIIDHSDRVWNVTFSPDGGMLASGGDDGTIRLWDPHTGQQIGEPITGFRDALTFSPDGEMIAGVSSDGTIRLWDPHSGQQLGELISRNNNSVVSVAFSPDGEMLASGGYDGTIRLWDPHTGQQIGEHLSGHSSAVNSLVFSPDGKILASGSWDRTIRLWNTHTGLQLGESLTIEGRYILIFNVTFSPDGEILASGSNDGTIRLWDAHTGQQLGEYTHGSSSSVLGLTFSPDGKLLASGSYDGTIHLWDAQTGQQLGEPFSGHNGNVNSVAFSPDGEILASGGEDGTIRLWNVGINSWVEQACRRARRNLSLSEWNQFFPNEEYRLTCPDYPDPREP